MGTTCACAMLTGKNFASSLVTPFRKDARMRQLLKIFLLDPIHPSPRLGTKVGLRGPTRGPSGFVHGEKGELPPAQRWPR
eukprot:12220272-Alexandrium_andersonii.AAC.1